jgi:hypothetical protein
MAMYEIRVAGVVAAALLREMEGVRVAVQPVHSVLRGSLPDQAALHGVINRLQALGLDLIEVRRLTPVPDPGPGRDPGVAG